MRLRPGQVEVAGYSGGYLAVPAVPGAGKTTCLAYLAARLIRERPGEKILVVTVMNSAVANFKHKISGFLNEMGLPPKGYEVKTLHSLALQILKEKPEFMLVNEAFEIIDNNTRTSIIRHLTEEWLSGNEDRWVAFMKKGRQEDPVYRGRWRKRIVDMVLVTTKRIKLHGMSERRILRLREAAQEKRFEFLLWVLEIMDAYERHKKQDGQVDFDDLIYFAYRILSEDKGALEYFQNRWTYIFEDEAQDSTPLQQKILYRLCGKYKNLVRVGDTNQGIMRFSGTDPDIFRRFCNLSRIERQPICVASRSTQQIMSLANDFIDWVNNQYPVLDCRSALEPQAIVGVDDADPVANPVSRTFGIETLASAGDINDECALVAEKASSLATEHPGKTIAVLLSRNDYVQSIGRCLQNKGVEVDYLGNTADLDRNFHRLADLWTVVRFLSAPYEPEYLLKIAELLAPDLENDRAAVGRFLDQINPEDLFYPVGGDFNWSKLPDELTPGMVTAIQRAVKTARRWLEMSHLRPDELVLQLAAELHLDENERDIANSLSALISRHLRQYPQDGVHEVAGEIESMNSHLKYMAEVLLDSKGFTPRPGVVTVSTYHKAKGLEWDIVFMAGLAKDNFLELTGDKSISEIGYLLEDYKNPTAIAFAQLDILGGKKVSGDPIRQAKIMEICEDLRLMYVAFTRARERLYIGTHKTIKWGERETALPPSKVFRYLADYIERKSNG